MAGNSGLLAVIGPTGSGKSALALAVARRRGAEILSADSMQVYRQMNAGTAKPLAEQRRAVPHHLLDLAEPDEVFTVARFVERADAVIEDARRRGVGLIVAGGTPLYYKALFQGLFAGPPADEPLRRRLREWSNQALHERLMAVDAAAAGRIHPNDTRRMIRALEVYEQTGRPISALQREWGGGSMTGGSMTGGSMTGTSMTGASMTGAGRRHAAVWVGLAWDRQALNRRINARTRAMLEAGWLEETRRLMERYGQLSKSASGATGYRELMDHLEGRISLDEAVERIKIATRQLARRQMKWFRRFEGVTWIAGDQPLERQVEQVLMIWDG
jgi:tRNA dimethylallyltransferase